MDCINYPKEEEIFDIINTNKVYSFCNSIIPEYKIENPILENFIINNSINYPSINYSLKEIYEPQVMNLDLLANGLNKLVTFDSDRYLVDANINSRFLKGLESFTYATELVANEAGGKWSNLEQSHILKSYTLSDIGKNGLEITAFDRSETVYCDYSPDKRVICDGCGNFSIVTLTSTSGGIAYICPRLSGPDQSNIIMAVVFPTNNTFNAFGLTLLTDEKCLGSSSKYLHSFSVEKETYWENYYEFKKLINNKKKHEQQITKKYKRN